jgi:hypothetical protein
MDTQVVSRESIASSCGGGSGGGGGGGDSCARCPVLERERDDAVTKNVTLLAATKKPGAGWASTVEGLHGRSKGAARCGIALFGKLSEKPLQSDDSDDGEDEEALDHRPRRAAATAAKVSLGARSASRSDETHRSNVAFGAAESERKAQGIDFYLAKVIAAPTTATQLRVVGKGKTRWNIAKGELYLKVRWFKEARSGVFYDEAYEEEQLLEMVVQVAGAEKLVLEKLSSRGPRTKPKYKLAERSADLICDENLTKYVDRAAHGSSA